MRRILICLGLALVAACSSGGAPAPPAGLRELTIQEAAQEISLRAGDADFTILDVRTPGEYAAGHLAGAINIDFLAGAFDTDVLVVPLDGTCLVYCQAGSRSAGASQAMLDLGFFEILDMTDGYQGWVDAGMPTVTN